MVPFTNNTSHLNVFAWFPNKFIKLVAPEEEVAIIVIKDYVQAHSCECETCLSKMSVFFVESP